MKDLIQNKNQLEVLKSIRSIRSCKTNCNTWRIRSLQLNSILIRVKKLLSKGWQLNSFHKNRILNQNKVEYLMSLKRQS